MKSLTVGGGGPSTVRSLTVGGGGGSLYRKVVNKAHSRSTPSLHLSLHLSQSAGAGEGVGGSLDKTVK